VHGGAVTTFLPLSEDGSPRFCELLEPPPDDPPELPPLELDCVVQGGTMIVVTPLLLGSTSWFVGWPLDDPPDEPPELPPLDPPEDDELDCAFTPPGVSRIVLDGGGWLLPLDEEPPLDPPEDDELDCSGGGHACTAIVCVRVPCGTTTWFDPGGIFELPDCVTAASEHGGTAIVRSACCLGITTVRTPGLWSAVETASCCFLLPQAVAPSASAVSATAPNARKTIPFINYAPP
jgi:hypothetical protein